jgi:hypothetical protein
MRLAITLARTTTVAIIAHGTIGVGTATGGRAITGQAGKVTGLNAHAIVSSISKTGGQKGVSHFDLSAVLSRCEHEVDVTPEIIVRAVSLAQ